MRQLHEMTIQAVQDRRRKTDDGKRMTDDGAVLRPPSSVLGDLSSAPHPASCDYLSSWWDGIGDWRNPSSG
jgi:hypothetical protein